MVSLPAILKDHGLFKDQSYIDGNWIGAASGQTFEVHNPSNGTILATMPELDVTDVQHAVEAANQALPSWSKALPRERGSVLRRWSDLINNHLSDLATLITLENGKPYYEAEGEVKYAAGFVEWFSEEAPRVGGEQISASVSGRRVYTIKEPVGVCGLITPWNWPAGMVSQLNSANTFYIQNDSCTISNEVTSLYANALY